MGKTVKSSSTNSTTKRKPKAPKDWRVVFLSELSLNGSVSFACIKAKVNRQTAYSLRNADAGFREAWEEALILALDRIEVSFHKRATNVKDGASHVIGMFLLKSRRREIYGEPKGDTIINVAAAVAAPVAKAALEAADAFVEAKGSPDGPADLGPVG